MKNNHATLCKNRLGLGDGEEYKANDIIVIEKGEATDFKVLSDTITVVVKTPSVPSDKYIAEHLNLSDIG